MSIMTPTESFVFKITALKTRCGAGLLRHFIYYAISFITPFHLLRHFIYYAISFITSFHYYSG